MKVQLHDVQAEKSSYGTRTIVAENGFFRLELFPSLGAKIYSLIYKPLDVELLWQNRGLPPRKVAAGSLFDDTWSGGWDELFPNDEPVTMEGVKYPDHGELWTAEWHCECECSGSNLTIYLRTDCQLSGTRMEKWITLRAEESRLHFNHRLTNLRNKPLSHLWKLHPAFAVSPGDRIVVPVKKVRLEPSYLGTLQGAQLESRWPIVRLPDRKVDLSVVPPAISREMIFVYGLDLEEGWYSIYRPGCRLAMGMSFPKRVFPSCWLFSSYGAWRDYYFALLEPTAGYPFRLKEAIQSGNCGAVPPLGEQNATVVFSARHEVSGVSRLSPEGNIEE